MHSLFGWLHPCTVEEMTSLQRTTFVKLGQIELIIFFFSSYPVVLFLSYPSMMGHHVFIFSWPVYLLFHCNWRSPVQGSVAEWHHQVAALVVELHSCNVTGQICSGYVPFTQRMMAFSTLGRWHLSSYIFQRLDVMHFCKLFIAHEKIMA